MKPRDFEGKTAIVTGAGSGIGAEIAKALAERGAQVMVTDLNASQAAEVAETIGREGGVARSYGLDVTDPEATEAAVAETVSAFGGLNFGVNNAGIATPAFDVDRIPLEEWNRQIAVNLTGVFFSMQAELRQMLAQGRGGSIVNTASIVGVIAVIQRGGYAAAKHGVVGLTRTAALDYAERGIRVNAIAPGYVDTPILKDRDAAQRAEIAGRHPMNRMAHPREIAEGVLFLLSDQASFITGTVLGADGGYTAW